MAYCRSCGVSRACKNPKMCDRPVDEQGNHLRAGKRYKQLSGARSRTQIDSYQRRRGKAA